MDFDACGIGVHSFGCVSYLRYTAVYRHNAAFRMKYSIVVHFGENRLFCAICAIFEKPPHMCRLSVKGLNLWTDGF